ncbi:MAG: NRDE family protein, partial [Deltaproteobacteria bacterium]|nr:NRDE family protein [Deltaproteobacteria bacterium]
APAVRELPPGVHVLENRPLTPVSPKAAFTARALVGLAAWPAAELVERLHAVLKSHQPPPDASSEGEEFARPKATEAACVHAGPYGTRSATIVLVPQDGATLPDVYAADGPPCTTPFRQETALWDPPHTRG